MAADILSHPAVLDQVQRFAERLAADAARIEAWLENIEEAEREGVSANTEDGRDFAEETPAIQLIGVLLQLSKAERLSTLTADGGLTLEAAQRALRPVERLENIEPLRSALSDVLPSWFVRPGRRSKSHVLSLDPPAQVGWLCGRREAEAEAALGNQLRPLERQGLIQLSGNIAHLKNDPTFQLSALDVLVVLVSPGLWADDEVAGILARALDPQLKRALQVVPVLVEPTDLEGSTLATLQPLPMDGQPVLTRSYPSEAWLDVTQGIRRLAKHLRQARRQASATQSATTPSGSPKAQSTAPQVTVLYHPSDRALFAEFELHLAPLLRAGQIALWHPGLILPGADIATLLSAQVRSAAVVVLFLSPAFVADERMNALVEQVLNREENAAPAVLPLFLKPFVVTGTRYASFQLEHRAWIAGMTLRDDGWAEVIQLLRKRLPPIVV